MGFPEALSPPLAINENICTFILSQLLVDLLVSSQYRKTRRKKQLYEKNTGEVTLEDPTYDTPGGFIIPKNRFL